MRAGALRVQDLFATALLALARRLQVDDPTRIGWWLWRLFVRPVSAPTHMLDRWMDAALKAAWLRAAAELGVRNPYWWRDWAWRLFVPPSPPRRVSVWRPRLRAAWVWVHARLPAPDPVRWQARLDAAAAARWLACPSLRAAVLAATLGGGLLIATTPLSWQGQLAFSVVLLLLALWVRRLPGPVPALVLIGLALLATLRYGWWRVTYTMELASGWEAVLGWGLLAAEAYVALVVVLGFVQTARPLRRPPLPMPPDPAGWPAVDFFIPTYNEPLSVLEPTVLAAQGIDWPADKLRIYILDDGRREAVRAFAAAAGVEYLTRPDNAHAKAGNLNHALAHTDGEFVAIFDCDHLPVRSFLQTSMGWMLADARCALVQTPHHFFSPDPFERNLGTQGRVPNEGRLFYGLIQDGNDLWHASFFCGSCAVLRRKALQEVGGIAVETVTEDAHTALKMHRRGWRSAYLNITQAAGLATESLSAHVGQRIRWARGMAQIWRIDNPLRGHGLGAMQRLCYANAMLHFFYGLPRLVFLTAPLAYLFFELHIIRAAAPAIALYALPHMILPGIANARVQGPHRHSFWAEVYETVLAWYITLPTLLALVNPKLGKFNVTAKGGLVERTHFDWVTSKPYLLLVTLNALGLGLGLVRLLAWNTHEPGTVLLNLVWVLFNLLLLGAALGVARERRQLRAAHRVSAQLPVSLLLSDGRTQRCLTTDYAWDGLGVALAAPLALQPGDAVQVVLGEGGLEQAFAARVYTRSGLHLGLRFEPMDLARRRALIQRTFARADAWSLQQSELCADRPLQGLKEIAQLGLRGHAVLMRALLDRLVETSAELRRRLGAATRAGMHPMAAEPPRHDND